MLAAAGKPAPSKRKACIKDRRVVEVNSGGRWQMTTKTLALLCKLCPFCNVARMFPSSKYAKMMAKAEKNCPACKAYRELYGWPAAKS